MAELRVWKIPDEEEDVRPASCSASGDEVDAPLGLLLRVRNELKRKSRQVRLEQPVTPIHPLHEALAESARDLGFPGIRPGDHGLTAEATTITVPRRGEMIIGPVNPGRVHLTYPAGCRRLTITALLITSV